MELLRPKQYGECASLTFDPDNARYKFCCESFKAAYGAIAVGILEMLGAAGFLSHVLVNISSNIIAMSCSIAFSVITVAIVALMIYGLRTERARLVFPHLIYQMFGIVGFLMTSIILVFSLLDKVNDDILDDEEQKTAGLVAILGCFFSAGFEIWFFLVVLSAYRFLNDKSTIAVVDV